MLSPTAASTPWILAAAVAITLALMVLRALRQDRREYRRFKLLRSTARRQVVFRRWVLQSLAMFGGASAVLLLLSWPFVGLLLSDLNSIEWVMDARLAFASSGVGPGIAIGVSLALVAGAVFGIVAARRETEIPSLGDVQALLPRNRAELRWGAALSINAGVVEELMFRLALPAALYGITRNAVVAIIASLLIFGALHAYQGVTGIVASLVIGTVLMAIYLATENILFAIVVHALFDLRSLVLIPVVLFKVHRVTSGNGRVPRPAARPAARVAESSTSP
jgi:membrane protease YdiL (CAAX protease family)